MEKELVMNTPNTAMEETNRSLQRREKGEKAKKAVALTFVWIMLLVMYLPIMYLILYSFTDSKVIGQWNGLNFDCYATLFNGSNVYAKQIWEATWNTVWVAVVASTLSTVLGTAGAIGMHFLGKKLKAVFNFANEIPIVNAEIVMALSLCILFAWLNLPTSAFSLIIGCHGMGWVPAATYNHSTRYFGGDSENTHTEVPDLAAAIADADMHMDFILFDDCYMACVEVAYELRAVTDYLLASPAEIMDYGMPYQNLFHFLATRSHDYTSVMTAFEDFYSTYNIPSGTYSAIDCREAEAMAALMKEANENHLFDTSLEPTLQVYDGMKVNGTYKHAFYDLGDYAEKLCGDDATLLGRIQQQVQRLVPFKATTGTFYSKFDGLIQPISIYSGITVSDPTTNYRFTPSLHDTSWWHATHDVS